MYKRLNITLPKDVLASADAFALRERYTRSALISAALEAYVGAPSGTRDVVQEASAVYAPPVSAVDPPQAVAAIMATARPEAVGLNPHIAPRVLEVIDACRRHGVTWAALVGSSTQPQADVVPRDLDILVRFVTGQDDRMGHYFGLLEDLGRIMGIAVDIIEIDAVRNPYLRQEFERTKVVLYEAA